MNDFNEEHFKTCEEAPRTCNICNTDYKIKYSSAHSDYFCEKISKLKNIIQDAFGKLKNDFE